MLVLKLWKILRRPFVKLVNDVTEFMVDIRRSSDKNTKFVNKVIMRLSSTVQTMKVALSKVRTPIQGDNTEMNINSNPSWHI